jgi:hypothetical protein
MVRLTARLTLAHQPLRHDSVSLQRKAESGQHIIIIVGISLILMLRPSKLGKLGNKTSYSSLFKRTRRL